MLISTGILKEVSGIQNMAELFKLIKEVGNKEIVFVVKDTGKVITEEAQSLDTTKGEFIIKDVFYSMRKDIVTGKVYYPKSNKNERISCSSYNFKHGETYIEVKEELENTFVNIGRVKNPYFVVRDKSNEEPLAVLSKDKVEHELSELSEYSPWKPVEGEMFVYVSTKGKLSIGVASSDTIIEPDNLIIMPYGFPIYVYERFIKSLQNES